MAAQINILQALSETNAAYGATRRMINQAKAQRSEIISSLLSSYNTFLNISQKAEEAKEFYSKLEGQVNKLSSRVKSFCKVQEEEREEKLAANVKKFGGNISLLNRSTDATSGGYNEPGSSGPKLKDFLQAGKSMQTDMTSVNMGVSQADYRYRGLTGTIPPSQMLPTYRNPPSRPAPVGSEKTDIRTSSNSLPSSYQPHMLPSAPSTTPSQHLNTSSYYTQGIETQPHQLLPHHTSASSMTSVTPMTNVVFSNAYPNYGYSLANTSIPASNLLEAPSSYTTSAYSNTNLNYSTQSTNIMQSSTSYQSPVPHQGAFSLPTPTPPGAANTQPPTQNQPYAPFAATRPQAPVQNTSQPYPGQQLPYRAGTYSYAQPTAHCPITAAISSPYSAPSSNSSQNYISQAGVYNTTLSSSLTSVSGSLPTNCTSMKSESAEVRSNSSYYPHYSYGSKTNFAQSTYSSFSTTGNQIAPKSDSYPTPIMTTGTSNQVNTNVKAPSYDKGISGSSSVSYQQGHSQSLLAGQHNFYNYPQTGPTSYPRHQGHASSHSSLQNPSSISPVIDPYKQTHHASLVNAPSTMTSNSPYQHIVSSDSHTYQTLQSTHSSTSYNYTQPSVYATALGANQTVTSGHFQAPQQHPQSYVAAPQAPHSLQQPSVTSGKVTTTTIAPQPASNTSSSSSKSSQGGISNLDLLSDIDMSASAASHWSILAPQTALASDLAKPLTGSSTGPDVTATTNVALEEEKPKENGTVFSSSELVS